MKTDKEKLASVRDKAIEMAQFYGVEFKPNTSTEELLELVSKALIEGKTNEIAVPEKTGFKESDLYRIKDVNKDGLQLMYVKIICLNPEKQGLTGDIFSAGNAHVDVTKSVLFKKPQWVPKIIVNMIRNKKYTVTVQLDENNTGGKATKTDFVSVNEYDVQELPLPGPEYFEELKRKATELKQRVEDVA